MTCYTNSRGVIVEAPPMFSESSSKRPDGASYIALPAGSNNEKK